MKTLKLLIILSLLGFTAKAQVGINTLDPDTTAILHIYSNTKGVLLPILDSNERAPLRADAADGLLVYDSIEKIYYFFNRATKEWIALNPFQTREKNSTGVSRSDVRLADHFNDRNVVIGEGDADVDAKLHVKGNIKSTDSVVAKNARMNEAIIAVNAHISDSTWSAKIGATSVRAVTANISDSIRAKKVNADTIRANAVTGAVPIGTIVMWTPTVAGGALSVPPDCWEEVKELRGRFPVGAGQASNGGIAVRSGDLDPNYSVMETSTTVSGVISHGRNQVALTESQMPPHVHALKTEDNTRGDGGTGAHRINLNYSPHSSRTESAGGSNGTTQAHENRPPFYGVYFIRKTSNNCPN